MSFLQWFRGLFKIKVIKEEPLEIFNDGFIPEIPTDEDFQFGDGRIEISLGAAKKVIKPDGQWLDDLPEGEPQRRKLETFMCVSSSAENFFNIFIKAVYDLIKNKSERALAKTSDTNRRGNTFIKVANSFRKDGIPKESSWPFTDDILTWEEFYKTIPIKVIKESQAFLNDWKVNYEWVKFSKKNFIEALKYSPLQVGVLAWQERNGKYYMASGQRYNHATLVVGYVEGSHWLIFDSYEPFIKKLEWNYPIYQWAMRYNFEKIEADSPEARLFERVKGKLIMTPHRNGEVYRVNEDHLKKVPFIIGDEKLFKKVHNVLRKEKAFLGISNDNFDLLVKYLGKIYGEANIIKEGEVVVDNTLLKSLYNLE